VQKALLLLSIGDPASMKTIRSTSLLVLCLLSAACHASPPADAGNASTSPRATATMPSARAPAPVVTAYNPYARPPLKLPGHFTAYATESIGNDQLCVAGTVTDEDGMHQKPVAYVAQAADKEAANKHVLWLAKLEVPADMYESRATHCTRHGNALFVLLQSDTQSEQTLSQTLLRVVKLDAQSGAVQLQRDVDVSTAYSAWVDEGSSHFQWNGDHLIVTGNEKLDSNHERQATFTARLNDDLKP
jgi:hypothetical protein